MNIQKENGIGWTKVPRWNEETGQFYQLPGATWNPMTGCFHGCEWVSVDGGAIAQCYAKSIAEGLAAEFYPHGFEHHYWYPDRLIEPLQKNQPHGIFVGSMGDLFGAWVSEEQIKQVLDVMCEARWHTFMVLTKNPKRLKDFNPFPANVWVGTSLPSAGREQRGTAIFRVLDEMAHVEATVRFLSAEPLWDNAGHAISIYSEARGELPLEWMIVGAMSRGRKLYQPESDWVEMMVLVSEDWGIPFYAKRNLTSSDRQDFPMVW